MCYYLFGVLSDFTIIYWGVFRLSWIMDRLVEVVFIIQLLVDYPVRLLLLDVIVVTTTTITYSILLHNDDEHI